MVKKSNYRDPSLFVLLAFAIYLRNLNSSNSEGHLYLLLTAILPLMVWVKNVRGVRSPYFGAQLPELGMRQMTMYLLLISGVLYTFTPLEAYFQSVWERARSQIGTRCKGKSFRSSLSVRNELAPNSFPAWLKIRPHVFVKTAFHLSKLRQDFTLLLYS